MTVGGAASVMPAEAASRRAGVPVAPTSRSPAVSLSFMPTARRGAARARRSDGATTTVIMRAPALVAGSGAAPALRLV